MNLLDFEVLQFVTGGDLCYASDDEVKLRHVDCGGVRRDRGGYSSAITLPPRLL